jgi:hypothetical protein
VAISFLKEYHAGRGVVIRVTNTDPLLVLVSVIEVSDTIKIPIPFPVHDVRLISQCKGKDIIWKARYLVPFGEVDDADGIGCRPIPCTQGHRPHRQYLDLAVGMEVALLVCSTDEDECVGLHNRNHTGVLPTGYVGGIQSSSSRLRSREVDYCLSGV